MISNDINFIVKHSSFYGQLVIGQLEVVKLNVTYTLQLDYVNEKIDVKFSK